jgi:hypothetical protein
MAIALDDYTNNIGGGTSFSFAHECSGSDRILIVQVYAAVTSDPTGVTYNGVAMTKLYGHTVASTNRASIWFLLAPATGSNNVVISHASSVDVMAISASFTGVEQVTPPISTGSGTADSVEIMFDVLQDNTYMIEAVYLLEETTTTPDSGQTELVEQIDFGTNSFFYKEEDAAEEVEHSITFGASTTYRYHLLCLAPVTAVAGQPIRKRYMNVPFGSYVNNSFGYHSG